MESVFYGFKTLKLNTMITEEKIVEILKQFEQQDYKRGGVSIDPSNYNAIARTVVKNCSIPDVSHRRELLIDFINWQENEGHYIPPSKQVGEYLKSINCG